jgi:hypothetical protein
VAENRPVGTTVGTLTATDGNAGDMHSFLFVSGSGGTDNGSFTIIGNTLQTAASFDYETKSSYSIRVRATDLGTNTFEKQFTITVTDANDPPVANLASYHRNPGMSLKIPVANLLETFTTDADNDTRTFQAIGAGTNSATILNNATHIFYLPSTNAPNCNTTDHFRYEVGDGRGGFSTNLVRIMVDSAAVGPIIQSVEVINGHTRIRFYGIPNLAYRVQRAASLNGPDTVWTSLSGTATETSSGSFEYEDTSPPSEAFYRVIWP